MLTDDATCASPSVVVDGAFAPGATISVTVSCSTSTTGLELISAVPDGAHRYTAYAVIDPYRGVES